MPRYIDFAVLGSLIGLAVLYLTVDPTIDSDSWSLTYQIASGAVGLLFLSAYFMVVHHAICNRRGQVRVMWILALFLLAPLAIYAYYLLHLRIEPWSLKRGGGADV